MHTINYHLKKNADSELEENAVNRNFRIFVQDGKNQLVRTFYSLIA